MTQRRRRTSAFAYLVDRSVGIRNDFQDAIYTEEAQFMQAASRNFIYQQGKRVWTMAMDPVDDQYLLVGTANSLLMLFDLAQLDDAAYTKQSYDTSNPLLPICSMRARAVTQHRQSRDQQRPTAQKLQYGLTAVDWYPVDAGILVSSSFDGTVKIWDANTFETVSDFALGSKVFHAKFSPVAATHSLIAATTAKGEVRLCDMATEGSLHSLLGHQDEVWTLAWSPENEFHLSTGSRNGEIRMWDIRRSGSTACLLCLNHSGKAVVPGRAAIDTNPTLLKVSTKLGGPSTKRRRLDRDEAKAKTKVKRNDPHLAASVSSVVAHHAPVNALAYTPDGRFLLSSGLDHRMRLWHGKTGEHLFVHYDETKNHVHGRAMQMAVVQEGRSARDSSIVFHPNGKDGQLASYPVFGSDTGKPLTHFTAHYQQISSCVYRKSHRELYTGGEDGLIMRWTPTPVRIGPRPDLEADGDVEAEKGSEPPLGVADGDVDAWSDEDDDGPPADLFVPPILRQ
ncbi:TPA: hypothetical protein N0F65_003805 [Lagenidium giganteum]|uniref:DNA excision repair protein ERCC-8 n=1 Tax=Lagenidium giganteum TaxID=4803 RepID=A0AAV2YZL7_9STRA|nr:TPA: hypothetical protein N0F65_003805 [Lagenidium giganteum]